MSKLLFLCTGNYYRSRFAELYFRHLAVQYELEWTVDSRGLQVSPGNVGNLSHFTQQECDRLGICTEPTRSPLALTKADLESSTLTIAVKETEHRQLMREKFSAWERKIEYWEIHDLDFASADEALPCLKQHVDTLFERLIQRKTEFWKHGKIRTLFKSTHIPSR